jgi:hypothetical protein
MTSLKDRPTRIEVEGDVLLLDAEFHKEVLAGSSRRTGQRLEVEGLPYVMVGGCKYRPLNAGRAWLAARITRKNTPQKPRRAGGSRV